MNDRTPARADTPHSPGVTRRNLLRSAAALAGMTASGWIWDAAALPDPAQAAAAGPLDTLIMGNSSSESAHSLSSTRSTSLTGALSQSARRFNPTSTVSTWGGTASFTMKCDAGVTTYVTVKMWGGEKGANQGILMLLAGGEQVGWYFLGDVDPLDVAADDARTPGRFYYHTIPLPTSLTSGKSTITLGIESMGPMATYAGADGWYQNLSVDSRAVYRVYTHTKPYFSLASDDVQGSAPAVSTRTSPTTSSVLSDLDSRINSDINSYLSGTASSFDLWQVLALAQGYRSSYTPAYQNTTAVTQILAALDALYVSYLSDSTVMTSSSQQWEGFGKVGWALVLIRGGLGTRLDQGVTGASGTTRRTAYTKMLVDSRDYWRQHLPQYSNQMAMCALGIYECNRGLTLINSGSALAESDARAYLYQAMGLSPWLGPEDSSGTPSKPLGGNYYQITPKGLTKELGYVGLYGGWNDLVARIYQAVTTQGGVSDSTLRAQCLKFLKTRANFTYPGTDADGYKTMRLATQIGWRDYEYPGRIEYDQRGRYNWDGHPLQAVTVFNDSTLNGYAQQMIGDGQYGAILDDLVTYSSTRVTCNLVSAHADYDTFSGYTSSSARLPMTDGQSDFVWFDPENGVIVLKRDPDRLYIEAYWRARYGINNLARVHLVTPAVDRSATIRQFTTYSSSGLTYTIPNWINWAYSGGGYAPPSGAASTTQGFAGDVLPVAAAPSGVTQPASGTESPFSGRGLFYTGQYGGYQYGLNASSSTTYTFTAADAGTDMVTGNWYSAGATVSVAPLSAAVLYMSTSA
ncbi:hypothetical protein ACFWPQ_42220 [Streptomyces sp. NPDC058464]|uniref:hypothetical protein n=1 Tax=Streptomyces sp. NPDC058464 TaxID=3346511 RepID=UPI00364FBD3C